VCVSNAAQQSKRHSEAGFNLITLQISGFKGSASPTALVARFRPIASGQETELGISEVSAVKNRSLPGQGHGLWLSQTIIDRDFGYIFKLNYLENP
jgi:hypothetical protein